MTIIKILEALSFAVIVTAHLAAVINFGRRSWDRGNQGGHPRSYAKHSLGG